MDETTQSSQASVDGAGVHVCEGERAILDVLLEGERVWSFHPVRDTNSDGLLRLAAWPTALRPFLRGTARVMVREHAGSRVVFDDEYRFDGSAARVRVADANGRPLALDKKGRLQRTFAAGGQAAAGSLVDHVLRVLAALRDQGGLPAFLAFGALLGAVREGHLIAHDSDADVGYLSGYRHPVDVARESFRLERMFHSGGLRTVRFSAADFKVLAPDPGGGITGIDVFGGFVVDDTFYLMPNVRTPYRESMILPIGEVELEGRRVPAPADPEALLAATYGPDWAVPDPSFKFQVSRGTSRRLGGWMRGAAVNRGYWKPFYKSRESGSVPPEPSPFARWVGGREPTAGTLVDIGSGTGRDSLWFARQGRQVLGLDYVAAAVGPAGRIAGAERLPATFKRFNLYDLRQVLTAGAQLSYADEPLILYGRFLLHALVDSGRHNLWLLAGMALRRGGRLYLEFRTRSDSVARHEFGEHFRKYLEPDTVVAEIETRGGRVDYREEGRGMAVYKDEDPNVCRLVVRWRG